MLITELLGRREGGGKNRVGNQSMMWKHEGMRYFFFFFLCSLLLFNAKWAPF